MIQRSHFAACRARLEKKMFADEELKLTIHTHDARINRNKHEDKENRKTHEVFTEGAQQATGVAGTSAKDVDDDEFLQFMHESDDDDARKRA